MNPLEKFKEKILKDYPRLSKESTFAFRCHNNIDCFNNCCRDVNIFLTPYDIIRLKKKLNITSGEFLRKYTILPFDDNLKYPVVLLKMNDDADKRCPFVTKEGCSVYTDRPWSCRMYPVGLASPDDSCATCETNVQTPADQEEFYFLLQEDVCHGFNEETQWTIVKWMDNQGVHEYDDTGKEFKKLIMHPFFKGNRALKPQGIEMFHTVCYDTDKFRSFLFESSFFDRFDVDETVKSKIKEDDYQLLLFGYSWLRYSLFGEKDLLTVKPGKKEEAEQKLNKTDNK